MQDAAFYDIHCHLLNLSHPAFVTIIESMRHRPREVIYSQIASFDYLASSLLKRGGENLRNLLAVMDNDCADILFLLEDDLSGQFKEPKKTPGFRQAPPLRNGKLYIADQQFSSFVLTPLIMDFLAPSSFSPETYYNRPPQKWIEAQIIDVLFAICTYREKRPSGFLKIYPFLGINTGHYTAEELSAFLEQWLGNYTKSENDIERRFLSYSFDAIADFQSYSIFSGIKLYPPMGFDPWPEDPAEREKVELLYSFAETKGVPITTHCDDQGYRIISLEESLKFTAPSRYRPVLQKYPRLILNFAHMGKRHIRTIRGNEQADWRKDIFDLIIEYPNVYSDFSFTAGEPSFYEELASTLNHLKEPQQEKIIQRILFGSDFMVNLFKVRSYRDYLEYFSESVLSVEKKRLFCSDNPRRFLFGDQKA